MIRKIVLENFMSHKRTVIEPAEGLTVLTGPNNCGKSAVVVAIQAVCENDRSSKAFIRHGAKEASVTIETAEGSRVQWTRGKEVHYKIDGREVHRLRGGIPEDLHDKLRLPPVEDPSGDKVAVHFSDQKDPIFLVNDRAGARAARFLSAASDAALLLKMRQLQRERTAYNAREERRLARDVEAATLRAEQLQSVDALEPKCADLQARFDALGTALSNAEQLYGLGEAIASRAEELERLQARASVLAKAPEPPLVTETGPLSSACDGIARWSAEIAAASERVHALKPLGAPPVFGDVSEAARLVEAIARASRRRSCLAEKIAALDRVGEMPRCEDTASIEGYIRRVRDMEQALAQARASLAQIEEEAASLEADTERFLAGQPLCPTCGGRLAKEQIARVLA